MPSRDELINALWYDKDFAALGSNRARLEYALAKYLPGESLQEMVRKDIASGKEVNGKSLPRAKAFKGEADLLVKIWNKKKQQDDEKGDELEKALFSLSKVNVCYHLFLSSLLTIFHL